MWNEVLLDKGKVWIYTNKEGQRILGIKFKCYKPALM